MYYFVTPSSGFSDLFFMAMASIPMILLLVPLSWFVHLKAERGFPAYSHTKGTATMLNRHPTMLRIPVRILHVGLWPHGCNLGKSLKHHMRSSLGWRMSSNSMTSVPPFFNKSRVWCGHSKLFCLNDRDVVKSSGGISHHHFAIGGRWLYFTNFVGSIRSRSSGSCHGKRCVTSPDSWCIVIRDYCCSLR